MKKIITVFAFCMISSLVAAENMVQKVTYFPIDYAGYYDINARQLDVGLGRSALGAEGTVGNFQVQIGGAASATTALENSVLSLESASQFGVKLNANTFENSTVGYSSSANQSQVVFDKNLTITNGYLPNLNASTGNIANLNLFGKEFPSCKNTRGKPWVDSNGIASTDGSNIFWVRLKLGPSDKCLWYLSCGYVPASEQCTANSSPGLPNSQNFIWKYEGKQTYPNEIDCPGVSCVDSVIGNYEQNFPADQFGAQCSSLQVGQRCFINVNGESTRTCYKYRCSIGGN